MMNAKLSEPSPASWSNALNGFPERMARSDLQYFTEYLGYDNAPFHRDWYRLLQPADNPDHFSPLPQHPHALKRYHIEAPKKHGKSQCIAINYVSWFLGNHPDRHVLIVSETGTLSEQTTTAITNIIENDPQYIRLFGELKPRHPLKWTNNELTLQRPNLSDKFPSLYATGLFGSLTGGGYDLIIGDDLISEEDTYTDLRRQKASHWFFKVVCSLVFPWSGIFVIGTRWHYADLYSEMLSGTAEVTPWPHRVYKAIIDEPQRCVLWPEYWSYDRLCKLRDDIGTINFNCLYQNDPTEMQGDLLKSEWLQPWTAPPSHRCEYYAGLDPSLGEADFFGIATVAYDRSIHQYYLVDVWAEHLPFPDILTTKIPLLNTQYHYVKMYMEANFWQRLLFDMPELKGYPIVPVQTVRDKTSRFISMSSHFQSGRVHVNPLLLRRSEFWTEWVQYPRGSHDDALDATDLVLSRLIRPPPTGQPPALLI